MIQTLNMAALGKYYSNQKLTNESQPSTNIEIKVGMKNSTLQRNQQLHLIGHIKIIRLTKVVVYNNIAIRFQP